MSAAIAEESSHACGSAHRSSVVRVNSPPSKNANLAKSATCNAPPLKRVHRGAFGFESSVVHRTLKGLNAIARAATYAIAATEVSPTLGVCYLLDSRPRGGLKYSQSDISGCLARHGPRACRCALELSPCSALAATHKATQTPRSIGVTHWRIVVVIGSRRCRRANHLRSRTRRTGLSLASANSVAVGCFTGCCVTEA
jgi:hypothetical protein